MSNRVEELESRVSELESTVRGLTEELVEANERIRTLEARTEEDEDLGGVEGTEIGVDADTSDEREADDDADDDIIVA